MSRESELLKLHIENQLAEQAYEVERERQEYDVIKTDTVIITSRRYKKPPTYEEFRKLSGYSD